MPTKAELKNQPQSTETVRHKSVVITAGNQVEFQRKINELLDQGYMMDGWGSVPGVAPFCAVFIDIQPKVIPVKEVEKEVEKKPSGKK